VRAIKRRHHLVAGRQQHRLVTLSHMNVPGSPNLVGKHPGQPQTSMQVQGKVVGQPLAIDPAMHDGW
jgi:hypothetical protein